MRLHCKHLHFVTASSGTKYVVHRVGHEDMTIFREVATLGSAIEDEETDLNDAENYIEELEEKEEV